VDGNGCAIGHPSEVVHREGRGTMHAILETLEAMGYEIPPVFDIPACAVNSPQLRHRYYIVAFAKCDGQSGPRQRDSRNCGETVSRPDEAANVINGDPSCGVILADTAWDDYVWVPCADGKVRRAPDDSFQLVDGLHRSILGALGNSQVPQVAYEIGKAVLAALSL
jgi:site-specific DNA-cytosine methylase